MSDPRADVHPWPLLSVLVVSPHPSVHGGVSAFAELLKARLTRSRATPLWVGSRQDRREGRVATLGRLFWTPLHLRRLVRGGRFDVVHINPSLDLKSIVRDGLLLLAIRRATRRRVLVYLHGWDDRFARRLERTPGLRHAFAWLLNGTARVLVLAPEFKESLARMGVDDERISLTRTMFDGQDLAIADGQPSVPGRQAILFMARLVPEKGAYELITAFARVARVFTDFDLVVAGDGPEKSRLQQATAALGLADRVSFPGYVGGEAKARLLRQCSVFALPSYPGEGLPIALLEAMAAGKPLLTSKSGGIRHLVSHPENGVVIDAVDIDAVEAGLRALLGSRELRDNAGRNNRISAWDRYEATRVTAEIEAMYRSIADHQSLRTPVSLTNRPRPQRPGVSTANPR